MDKYARFPHPLIEEDIRNLSTPSSFRLGKELFEKGGVEIRKSKGHTMTARVGGDLKRTVEFAWAGEGFQWRCTCRKNQKKFCKHAVALGLESMKHGEKTSP
jgi:uncharacterized Zn finger protein